MSAWRIWDRRERRFLDRRHETFGSANQVADQMNRLGHRVRQDRPPGPDNGPRFGVTDEEAWPHD